tara:strand:+ start:376 stop:702 length:327 start_codon:yes stop_codon:yes gene_type:complete
MTDNKIPQWLTQSLFEKLDTDYEDEILGVEIVSWEWEPCPFTDQYIAIRVVAIAWPNADEFEARYSPTDGWGFVGLYVDASYEPSSEDVIKWSNFVRQSNIKNLTNNS